MSKSERVCRLKAMGISLSTVSALIGIGSAHAGSAQPVELISHGPESAGDSDISPDGRWIAYDSPSHTWLYDSELGTTELVSVDYKGDPDNGGSEDVEISANGRYVAYRSTATNVFEDKPPQDEVYPYEWVFVRDMWTDTTRKYPKAGMDEMSGDGRWLVDSYRLTNLETGKSTTLPGDLNVSSYKGIDISYSGRYLAISTTRRLVSGDPNWRPDVYVYDRRTKDADLISAAFKGEWATGTSGAPHISASGRYVAFTSSADNLVPADNNGQNDAFVRDRKLEATTGLTVDRVDGTFSDVASARDISPDGSAVAVFTFGDDLISGKRTGSYLVRWKNETISPIPRRSCGHPGPAYGQDPSLSRDGKVVTFFTDEQLTPEDDLNNFDVFRRDMSIRCP